MRRFSTRTVAWRKSRIRAAGAWDSACSALKAAAAWLFVVHKESAQANRSEFKYRPIANSIDSTPRLSANAAMQHPLDEALAFVQPSLEALKSVKDYTAVFTKIELVHGRLLTQKMDMKFRRDPFSVYFHGQTKCKGGREVIFVAGRNDGKLVVHESGLKALVGTMNLTLDDPKVMATNRHAITEVGIAKIVESAIDIWNHEKKTLDPANIEVRRVHSVQAAGCRCRGNGRDRPSSSAAGFDLPGGPRLHRQAIQAAGSGRAIWLAGEPRRGSAAPGTIHLHQRHHERGPGRCRFRSR